MAEAIDNKELHKDIENSDSGQSQEHKQVEVDYEKQYKELQGEFDRRNESSYQKDLTIAKMNKQAILDMDEKTQNKVIKELYGHDNLEELKLIHGDKFYEDKSDEEQELDGLAQVQQELKLMKYKGEKKSIEDAKLIYIANNKKLFESDKDAMKKLDDEMKYISKELTPSERIDRAGRIAFGNYVDKTSDAYLSMQEQGSKSSKTKVEKTEGEQPNEISAIFDRRFKKG